MNYKDNNVVIPGLKSLPRTSSGGNLLSFWKILSLAAVMLFLAACSDDDKTAGGTEEDAGIVAIEDKTISGVSQKGPFVNGSSVTVYGLDGETLAQTGNIYEGKIKSDMGDFSVKVVKLASQYALLKANGFYRNEVTGEKSNSQMTLYALTDLSDRDEVNVNLLTHLAYERSLYLATDSLSVSKAKKQAEAEVFKSFEIEGDFGVAEDLNIFGENDQSAALLAISILMQGDLKEADFSERLDNYARDIEADGVWDDKKTATAIADWASKKSLNGGLATIRANVEKWGQLFGVPPFEKFVNNFWWQNYGLGTCNKKRQDEVKTNDNALSVKNGVYFVCDDNKWREATDIEKDTYKWNSGKDADIKNGDVVKSNCYVYEDSSWRSGSASDCSLGLRGCTALRQDTVGLGSDNIWYKCVSKNWRKATDIEKDTATWGTGTFDGEIRQGQVNKNVSYIYEGDKKTWREALEIEIDTYQKDCSKDGKFVNGNVNKSTMYVCDGGKFRIADDIEITGGLGCTSYNQGDYRILTKVSFPNIDRVDNEGKPHRSDKIAKNYSYYKCTENGWKITREKLNQGIMVDERDGQEYKTIGIGSQDWMAENLNYALPGKDSQERGYLFDNSRKEEFFQCARSTDYEDLDANCSDYGDWIKADSLSYCYNNDIDNCAKYGRIYCRYTDVCPAGWHVPDWYEALTLFDVMGDTIQGIIIKDWDARIVDWESRIEMGGGARFAEFFGTTSLSVHRIFRFNDYSTNELERYKFESFDGSFAFSLGNSFMAWVNKTHVDIMDYSEASCYPVRCVKDEE